MEIDIVGLLHEGIRLETEEGKKHEASKVGSLRGGNSGSLIETAEGLATIGGCARKALLRSMSLEIPDLEDMNSKAWMFAAGHLNEDGWVRWLERSWTVGPVLREADVPTNWSTRNGTPVTGRPDIVLAHKVTGPVVGLELKQASSIWTVRDVLRDKPKTPHLCQAGHYSWQLGVPFELHYANRVNYHVLGAHLGWIGGHFPRYNQRHSDKCGYKLGEPQEATADSVYKNGKVKPGKPAKPAFQEIFRVLPFVHGFKLRWDENGVMHYRPHDLGLDAEKQTLISQEGIREFYETAASAIETDKLPPRPAMLDALGEPAKWNDCTYCPLNKLCDEYHGGTRGWVSQVRKEVDSLLK